MSRISLWKEEKYGLDAQWFDKAVREQFVMGGLTAYIHKYMGAVNANIATGDVTQPNYPNQSAQNIGDLLFQETPNRVYSSDIYRLRCHFNVSDLDLDLSQFGLMLSPGALFITFHTVNMVDTLGRKLMAGDVLELPNMKEFYALDDTIPVALKRYYVVQDGTRPMNGYSPTWWSHLWRVKCTPMVNAQEFGSILSQPVVDSTGNTIIINGNLMTYGDIGSSQSFYQNVNDLIVQQAQIEVPESGYDTTPLWSPLFVNGNPVLGTLPVGSSPQQKWTGYLVGNGEAMDGYPVTPATQFPSNPTEGQYILRQDYFPARLYCYSGGIWQYVSSENRSSLTLGSGNTQRDRFVNQTGTFTNSSGNSEPILQNISNLLRADKGGNSNS